MSMKRMYQTQTIIQYSENLSSFMRALDLDDMQAPEFLEYVNMTSGFVVDGDLCVGMQFSDKKAIIRAIKNYNISKLIDYKVFESERTSFYCKCKHFGRGCDWLVRANLRKKKDVWKIRKYNAPY